MHISNEKLSEWALEMNAQPNKQLISLAKTTFLELIEDLQRSRAETPAVYRRAVQAAANVVAVRSGFRSNQHRDTLAAAILALSPELDEWFDMKTCPPIVGRMVLGNWERLPGSTTIGFFPMMPVVRWGSGTITAPTAGGGDVADFGWTCTHWTFLPEPPRK